jgi:excisionase family DNA binding protein
VSAQPDISLEPEPVFLTYAQASQRLGLSVSWLQDAVEARRIPCRRIGRMVRFTSDDLDQIVAMSRQPVIGEGRAPRRRSAARRRPAEAH